MFSTITHFKAPPLCLLAQFHTYKLRSLKQKKERAREAGGTEEGKPPLRKGCAGRIKHWTTWKATHGWKKGNKWHESNWQTSNAICQRKQTFDLQAWFLQLITLWYEVTYSRPFNWYSMQQLNNEAINVSLSVSSSPQHFYCRVSAKSTAWFSVPALTDHLWESSHLSLVWGQHTVGTAHQAHLPAKSLCEQRCQNQHE